METRNTKQKEIILNILSCEENKIHPTISELTALVLKKENSIGQATIYRNINKLVKEGKIKKVSTNNGNRYDINANLHGHLVCKNCGCIYDLYDENYKKLVAHLEEKYNIAIEDTNLLFDGVCSKCCKDK